MDDSTVKVERPIKKVLFRESSVEIRATPSTPDVSDSDSNGSEYEGVTCQEMKMSDQQQQTAKPLLTPTTPVVNLSASIRKVSGEPSSGINQ
jgi:hypothetical protein